MWIYCIITVSSQMSTHTQTKPTADSDRSNVSNNQSVVKCLTKPWNRSKRSIDVVFFMLRCVWKRKNVLCTNEKLK